MISPQRLEQWDAWRPISVTLCLGLAVLPAAPLTLAAIGSGGPVVLGSSYTEALIDSLIVAASVAGLATIIGLPTGVLAALYPFRCRTPLLTVAALPALVPSFLLAIGWSSLTARMGPAATQWLAGHAGCILIFCAMATPIVLLIAFAATVTLSGSQLDAARLAGGEKTVVLHACRHALAPSLLAGALAGVMTLSDPGPGQIFGLRSAASEIMVSFSALFDFGLAGRQSLVLAVVVLILALPLAAIISPNLASQLMSRQVRTRGASHHPALIRLTFGLLMGLIFFGFIAPMAGLILPLARAAHWSRAWSELARTGPNTLIYGLGPGIIGTGLGVVLAFSVGRHHRLGAFSLGACIALFAQPPALISLGMVQLATGAPAWADPLLRSRLTVCLALGLRLFPIAAVLAMRSWGSMPVTWTSAAAIHGVPLSQYLRRVVAPFFLPTAAIAVLLIALIATADIGTVLLLSPPGEASLPLAIFTVMANAPESLVASLCMVYLLFAAGLLAVLLILAKGRKA